MEQKPSGLVAESTEFRCVVRDNGLRSVCPRPPQCNGPHDPISVQIPPLLSNEADTEGALMRATPGLVMECHQKRIRQELVREALYRIQRGQEYELARSRPKQWLGEGLLQGKRPS